MYSTRHLLSSWLHWFPREIDCPKCVAPEPHTHYVVASDSRVPLDRLHYLHKQLLLYAFVVVHPVILFHKIAQIVAMLTSGIHSFGDTLLPRVHTASQQAYAKLKIDSVRFYAHKFLQVMSLGLRKTQKRRKLVGRTMRDVQTIIRRRSSVQDCCTSCLLYTSPSPRDGLLSRMPSSA